MKKTAPSFGFSKSTRDVQSKRYEKVWESENYIKGPDPNNYTPYPSIDKNSQLQPYHGNISIQPDKGFIKPRHGDKAEPGYYEVLPGIGSKSPLSTQHSPSYPIISELDRPGPELQHMLKNPKLTNYSPMDYTSIHKLQPRPSSFYAKRSNVEKIYMPHADTQRKPKKGGIRFQKIQKNTCSVPEL